MIEPRAQNSSKLSDFLQIKSPTLPSRKDRALVVIPGDVLLSHKVALAVPSALEGLTSVFGMGTGVAPPLLPPGSSLEYLPPSPCRATAGATYLGFCKCDALRTESKFT